MLHFLEGKKEKATAKSKAKAKQPAAKKAAKSKERITVDDDEEEEDEHLNGDEDNEEALRARGLVADEEMEDVIAENGNGEADAGGGAEEPESVIGD